MHYRERGYVRKMSAFERERGSETVDVYNID